MQGFIYNKSWLVFDQPIIGIEPTLLKMNSVVCWKDDSSSQQINLIVLGLEVISDAAERLPKFDSEYNEILTTTTNDTLGCITKMQNFYHINLNLFKKYLDFFVVFNKFRNFFNLLKFGNSVLF